MSFNFNHEGKKFAIVKNNPKFDKKPIYVASDIDAEGFTSFHLNEGEFQQVPDPHLEREILYVVGASGSGKSYYTKNYIKEWKKLHRDGNVYVFSALKQDETLDELKYLKRVIIDESLISEPIEINELANSLAIFDDIDVISKKAVREAVYDILNQLLETGRHAKCSVILTNHLPTNGIYTRRILNESHWVVYFPNSGSQAQMKRLLNDYLGLEKSVIKRNKTLKSRWCCVHKNFPMFIMSQRDIYMLNTDDD